MEQCGLPIATDAIRVHQDGAIDPCHSWVGIDQMINGNLFGRWSDISEHRAKYEGIHRVVNRHCSEKARPRKALRVICLH
jgi:radical SAM protein with 4Fe4S-binding SPASM domain